MTTDDKNRAFDVDTNDIDTKAETEADSISRSLRTRIKRLRRYYYCDGFKFNTGARHRNGSCSDAEYDKYWLI